MDALLSVMRRYFSYVLLCFASAKAVKTEKLMPLLAKRSKRAN
jgi:hypothetical protein